MLSTNMNGSHGIDKAKSIYSYYQINGYHNWIIERVSKIVLMLAMASTYFYFTQCFDWHNPLVPTLQLNAWGMLLTLFMLGQTVIASLRVINELPNVLYARDIYRQLEIDDYKLPFLKWQDIAYRLVETGTIDNELEVQCSVTRDDNFIIGLVDKGLLFGSSYLSEFYIEMFKRCLKRYIDQTNHSTERLGSILRYYGIISLIMVPYMLCYHITYTIIKYAISVYKHPSTLFAMRWSVYSNYNFRHFNELPHEFEARMRTAAQISDKYNMLFPSLLRSKIAERLSFIISEVVIIIAVIALYLASNEYVKVITTAMIVWNFVQSLIDTRPVKPNPAEVTSDLKKILLPDRGFESDFPTMEDYKMLGRLYIPRISYGFNELMGVILTPIFLFYMSYHTDRMLADYIDYNIRVNDRVGVIFKGSDFSKAILEEEASASKLMQSYMMFESAYPMSQSIRYSKMLSSRFRD